MSAVVKVAKKVVKAAVNVVEDVVGVVGDAIEWVVDEVIQPVVKGVGDVIDYVLDNPIEAIAKIGLTVASGGAYLWAMPLVDGAITLAKGGSISDAVKSAAISYAGGKLGSVAGQYASTALQKAGSSAVVANIIGEGTKSATTALVYGQDPLKAFARGGLQAGVAAAMGKVSDTMQEQYGSKFEDLRGGVKDTIFSGLAAEIGGGNLSQTQMGGIIAKYSGVGDAMNKFLKDNAGFNDAQAAILTNATAAAVSKAIAGNPDGAGEEFFGSLSAAGAEALKTIIDKPVDRAIDKVSGAYDAAETKAKALNDTVDAAKAAADQYNSLQSTLAGRIKEQDRLKGKYDEALAAYNKNPTEASANKANAAADAYNKYATKLESDYNKNFKNQIAAAEAAFTKNNGQIATLQAEYDDAMDWVVSRTENLDAVLKPKLSAADKAVALTLRPNIDEDAYREAYGLDAGADVYGHFLEQGQKLPTDRDGTAQLLSSAHGDLIRQVLATEGMDIHSLEPESLSAVGKYVVDNIKNVKDITGIDFDSFADKALSKAREATPMGGVFPTGFSRADNVFDSDIASGKASLGVTSTGEMQWQKTADVNARLTGSGSGGSTIYTLEDLEKSLANQIPGVIDVKFVGPSARPTLADMINQAQSGDFGALSTSALQTIAGLNSEAGRLLDEYVTAPIYENAKTVYNYLNEVSDGKLGNAGSIYVGAGGEILQAVAGLSVIMGANPNNALGRAAKNMIALSGDMKSDEWKAAAKEMQDNSDNYDVKWREDNPGKEPSMAQKAYLKTKAIFGNIYDHPVQWVSENIVSELLQEVPIFLVSGGTGNIAKRALLEAGEAYAKKVAARVAMGTGVTLDAAEAFGGTAAGAFDEAYATYQKAYPDASAEDATAYAMDVAQKAGSIAVLTLAATAGIGGQALSKSLFGDKGSEFFVESYDALKKKVKDGVKVTVKEGVTESIEEALPQLYTATTLHQIDPSYDVAGSVAEAAVLGTLTGSGVAGGIYTGNAVADTLLRTNPKVKDTITKSGNAAAATKALKDLGISDIETLNNLLNTSYDTQYVTTTEAGDMFATTNPGFTPTEAEISQFVGKTSESNLAADVAAYVDPRFLDVDEVKAAAAAEGITLTDEQAEAYVGQKNESTAVKAIRNEYDPLATTTAEARKFFEDQGFTPTDQQIKQFVGAKPESTQKTAIEQYVDPRQVTEAEARKFFEDLGYEPTDKEVADYVGQKSESSTKTAVGQYVDPRQVTEEEARKFFTDQGYEPTEKEINTFIGQRSESTAETNINAYVDPRQVTEAEAREFFSNLGYEPTDEEVAEYTRQSNVPIDLDVAAEVGEYVDPRQVTEAEARKFFEDLGYTPTDSQVAARVGQKSESDTKTAIDAYVDPRQITEAEARKFFKDQGFKPTDEQVAIFVGQGGKNFTTTTESAVGKYVDPRQVTEAEAREFFTGQGYEPTEEEIAIFIGQRSESTAETNIGAYVDPRQVTETEARKFFTDQGYTPTEEEVAEYTRQSNVPIDLAVSAEVDEYVDPRQVTQAEARKFFEAQNGYTPSDEELDAFSGQGDANFATTTEKGVGEYVDPRQVTEAEARKFYEDLGYKPTDEEISKFVGQGSKNFTTSTGVAVGKYVDPRQVTKEEARQFFSDLGYKPTDEQVAQFVAQVEETKQKDVISKYVDPRQVTQAEVQAIADEEGLTLTEALAATYLGQSAADTFEKEQLDAARAEYDPLATTVEEATQFFADTNYTATTEEIAQFVASKTEEVQTSAIGAYVDPRQMTAEESREFLSEIGYSPTDEEVQQFTGQLNDENYQVTQRAAIDEYVDPRFFDAGEVRAAYEELGLVDVTQEDVDRFVGQYDPSAAEGEVSSFESSKLDAIREYMPAASFNSIKAILGSPAVADDPNTEVDESKEATGIYAAIEKGSSRSEALELAVKQLSTDLGLTEAAMLEQLGITREELSGEIDAIAETVQSVQEDVAGLDEQIAGVETNLTKLIEQNAGDVDTALQELAADLSTTEESILEQIGTTRDELVEEFTAGLTDVADDVGGIADILGTARVEDNPDTVENEAQDPTGLFATVDMYEKAGLARDEALTAAIGDVSTALGVTETNLLDSIGETETSLLSAIDDSQASLTDQITGVESSLGDQITDVAATLGADIDTIADFVGKPAREVTQEDVDFVIDLIAQENVAAETIQQYDVTGDGILDVNDQNMLTDALQGANVSLANTSMFTPATGLYLQQEQDTQAQLDAIQEMNQQQQQDAQTQLETIQDLNTQINTQIQTNQREDNINEMMRQIRASSDATGGRVDVTTPDVMNINYLYDIGGDQIFATESQAQLFNSPYGGTRVLQGQQGPTPANQVVQPRAQRRAAGFAEGGQVEDETDMLLRILGDMP